MSTPTAAQARQLATAELAEKWTAATAAYNGHNVGVLLDAGGDMADAIRVLTAASAAQEAEIQALEALVESKDDEIARLQDVAVDLRDNKLAAAEARLTAQEAEIASLRAREAQMRTALEEFLEAFRLPEVGEDEACPHGGEPDICDGCHYDMQRRLVKAADVARGWLSTEPE